MCPWFDSEIGHHSFKTFTITQRGQLAQSVEQLTENQCVLGSIPRLATTFKYQILFNFFKTQKFDILDHYVFVLNILWGRLGFDWS